MNKSILTLASLSLAVLAVSACTPTSEIQNTPPGKYVSETKTTNSNGTDMTVKKTTTVKADAYGNKTGTVQTKTTTDPQGLMNKSTSTSTTTVK